MYEAVAVAAAMMAMVPAAEYEWIVFGRIIGLDDDDEVEDERMLNARTSSGSSNSSSRSSDSDTMVDSMSS